MAADLIGTIFVRLYRVGQKTGTMCLYVDNFVKY